MVAINIPADGLALAVQKAVGGDYSEESCRRAVQNFIGKHLQAKPDILLLNICYRRSLAPSEVFDSVLYDIETNAMGDPVRDAQGQVCKRANPENTQDVTYYFSTMLSVFRNTLARGIDLFQYAAEEIKQSGCQLWLSFRMNDHHNLKNPALDSSFSAHPGVTLETEYYDYSQSCVQNYHRNYIVEQVRRYRPDGIELDWLRSPGVLPEPIAEHRHCLTDFNKMIRKEVDALTVHPVRIGVRVLSTPEANLAAGYDVAAWVASGAVDTVTVSNFYLPTSFEIPIDTWRQILPADKAYTLLCGGDFGVFCYPGRTMPMSTAMVKGWVTGCLGRGADGVYLFNFFEDDHITSTEFFVAEDGVGALRSCFVPRMAAAQIPNTVPRRHIHAGNSGGPKRYPISIAPGAGYTADIFTGSVPESCLLLVGTAELPQIELAFNGIDLECTLQLIPPITTERQSGNIILSPHELAEHVMYAALPISLAKDGENQIGIKNVGNNPLNIEWLELICR